MKLINGIEELAPLPSFDELSNTPSNESNEEKETQETTILKDSSLPEYKVQAETNTPENTNNTTDTPTEEKKPSNESVVKSLIKALNEEIGFLSDEELEQLEESSSTLLEKTKEAAYTLADSEVENYIKNNIEPFNQRLIKLFEEGVSEDKILQLGKERFAFKDVTKESLNPELAEQAYRTYLQKTTKFSPEKIEKEIQIKKDLDTLTEDGKGIFDELQQIFVSEEEAEIKKVEEYQESVKQQAQSRIEAINSQIEELDTIGGIKITDKLRKKLKEHFIPVQTDKGLKSYLQVEREKDPVSFDISMNTLSALGILKYDGRSKKFTVDFSNITPAAKNKVMEELENAVNKNRTQEKSQMGHSKLGTKQLTEEEQIQLILQNGKKILGIKN